MVNHIAIGRGKPSILELSLQLTRPTIPSSKELFPRDVGHYVDLFEAETTRYVAEHTTIPVPKFRDFSSALPLRNSLSTDSGWRRDGVDTLLVLLWNNESGMKTLSA
ncbi:hypothetical protein B0H34DRAFT_265778 [Crassisporium funariophilum]|nr:hypothetical protein B0H34DRAFT_265778 [Crassisporium funariophilum]